MPTNGEVVGVGVIGTGNFARRQHLPNLIRIPECRLRAVCDLRPDVVEAVRRRYGADYAATDSRRVLDDPEVAAVVIAVRDDAQAPLAIAALEAGKHVYVEKPLAETPAACAQVVAAQRQSGTRLAVGFNRRYAPIYRKAREIVAADGGPFNVHIRMADDAWRWAVGYPPGYLIKHDVCHLFDLLRWLSNSEVESVYCVSSRPDDDCMVLRMAGGCVASIAQSGHGTMDMPKERLEVICRRGGVTAEDFVELWTYGYRDCPPVFTFAGHSHPDHEFMHKHLFEKMGAQAMYAVRRMTWELRQRVEQNEEPEAPDAAEARRYVAQMLPNFMRDQGWLASLRAFLVGIATESPTEHAGAEDALAAARIAEAAVISRDKGVVVKLGASS
jgi:predicted dehydrogenase